MLSEMQLESICRQFNFEGKFVSIASYGDGHINDTYKVIYENEFEDVIPYILQKVNHNIFKETEKLMLNIENITLYLRDMVKELEIENDYSVLELIRTKNDKCYYKHPDGTYFRGYVFVENATGHSFIENNDMLYYAGKAFGEFQLLLKDYPVNILHETIKGFHNTPQRYERFLSAVDTDSKGRLDDCMDAVKFVTDRKTITPIITDGLKDGSIPYRVTHNDTKLNNVLLDNETLMGRCVIDLDTVMPGSALYDFGDAIRSCGSSVAEDEEDLSLMTFDIDRFEAYTKGFLEVLSNELTVKELDMLPDAAILMTLECGIRFLTDHLEGDHYFKVHKADHNLIRARNQFKFVSLMEANREHMIKIINKYR